MKKMGLIPHILAVLTALTTMAGEQLGFESIALAADQPNNHDKGPKLVSLIVEPKKQIRGEKVTFSVKAQPQNQNSLVFWRLAECGLRGDVYSQILYSREQESTSIECTTFPSRTLSANDWLYDLKGIARSLEPLDNHYVWEINHKPELEIPETALRGIHKLTLELIELLPNMELARTSVSFECEVLPSMAEEKGVNLFPNPGFNEFDRGLPIGWTRIISDTNEGIDEENKLIPGRDGTGSGLKLDATRSINNSSLKSPPFAVSSHRDYLFKGYYSSASYDALDDRSKLSGEGANLCANWLNAENENIGSFTIALPETQGRWVECFQEVRSPSKAKQLEIIITPQQLTGLLQFDDFSFRSGGIRDYEEEFSIPQTADEDFFPIFGWLTPGNPAPQFRGAGADNAPPTYTDYYHAEYALANFTTNLELDEYAGFGVKYRPLGNLDDRRLVEIEKDSMVWWLGGADEPGEKEFASLAQRHARLKRLAPSKGFWTNLFPTYADDFPSLDDYDHYIKAYIDTVKPSLLTYDHYALIGKDPEIHHNVYRDDYFANLEIVRNRVLEAGIEFGVILQVGGFMVYRSASEAELRWQVFTTLAYGARSLGWFCYLTEQGEWMHDMVIKRDGTRTPHYTMLKYLNGEVLAWAPTLLQLTSTGVYHTEPLPIMTRSLEMSNYVESISGSMSLIGEFKDKMNRGYIMIVNRNFSSSATLQVEFRSAPVRLLEISKTTGNLRAATTYSQKNGKLEVRLAAGDARLFRIEK